jgi:hypothetical protein
MGARSRSGKKPLALWWIATIPLITAQLIISVVNGVILHHSIVLHLIWLYLLLIKMVNHICKEPSILRYSTQV